MEVPLLSFCQFHISVSSPCLCLTSPYADCFNCELVMMGCLLQGAAPALPPLLPSSGSITQTSSAVTSRTELVSLHAVQPPHITGEAFSSILSREQVLEATCTCSIIFSWKVKNCRIAGATECSKIVVVLLQHSQFDSGANFEML